MKKEMLINNIVKDTSLLLQEITHEIYLLSNEIKDIKILINNSFSEEFSSYYDNKVSQLLKADKKINELESEKDYLFIYLLTLKEMRGF